MAFTEFYTQSGGSNLNAGSTTNNTAAFTYASGNWVASTGVFTVASGNPSSDGVAVNDFASVYADGSSVTEFVGRVTARDTTTITVSLTAKSGTAPTDGTGNRTLKIGGAWKGPNGAEAFPFGFITDTLTNSSDDPARVNMKNDATYSITAAISDNTGSSVGKEVTFQGYSSTVDDGGKAIIDGGTAGASYTLYTNTTNARRLQDLIFQNNGATGSATGISLLATTLCRRVVVNSVRGHGFSSNGGVLIECEAYSCNQSNTASLAGILLLAETRAIRCIAHDNTGSNVNGFQSDSVSGNSCTLINCIADSNGLHGFFSRLRASTHLVTGCDFYNNGGDGIRITDASTPIGSIYIENSNFVKNGGYGVNKSDSVKQRINLRNNAFGAGTQANTSGQTNGLGDAVIEGSITLSDDVTPWVDPANGDFRVTLAANKNTGRGSFTQTASSYAGTTGYPDVGAAQHLDSGGSSTGGSSGPVWIG